VKQQQHPKPLANRDVSGQNGLMWTTRNMKKVVETLKPMKKSVAPVVLYVSNRRKLNVKPKTIPA